MGTDDIGQGGYPLNPQLFSALAFTLDQADTGCGQGKKSGDKFEQMLVGLVIDGGCGNADFQMIVVFTNNFIVAGTGLDIQVQYQIFTILLYRDHCQLSRMRAEAYIMPCAQ